MAWIELLHIYPAIVQGECPRSRWSLSWIISVQCQNVLLEKDRVGGLRKSFLGCASCFAATCFSAPSLWWGNLLCVLTMQKGHLDPVVRESGFTGQTAENIKEENKTELSILIELSVSFYFILIFFKCLFIYLFLAALGLCCCTWAFSSCGEQGLLFLVVRGLLIAVASLVVEHRLSCSAACGIFPDQGSNPCPLHWQADS